MAVYSGSLGLQGVYLGSTPVQKIYLGTTEIWSGASPVQFVDANATGVNSVPIPTHAIGELIVLCAVNDYATQAPVKPSAAGTVPNWVYIDNTADTGVTTSYFKATATNHTSGTWTNTSRMIAVVLRGQNADTPIGGHASQRGTSSGPSTAPAITLDHTDGSSVLLYFHAHTTLNSTVWDAAQPVTPAAPRLAPGSSRACYSIRRTTQPPMAQRHKPVDRTSVTTQLPPLRYGTKPSRNPRPYGGAGFVGGWVIGS
ncbi:bacteriophage domain protein [Mycobacteroides abscessus subsp. bolletii 1513]|uniref:Bacteriophage domain protein n=1 Tax=Mycobacteroides abscessus subsp. bolletii 1513 TaxID=1299321 RepID=X8DWC1_9MYCO|nr:bacteriophage domain protein [Mycobacteroides abscessus subsp. bolletii 1513]